MVIVISRLGHFGLLIAPISLLLGGMAPASARASDGADRPVSEKAWLDARSVCMFRLGDGRMPQDSRELTVALNEGWKHAIALPDPEKAVFIDGGVYPELGILRIDFSDGRLKPGKNKDRIKLNDKVEKNLRVDHLEVCGQPMLLEKARLNMRLLADNALIDMERDKQGRPVMMLADATSGSLSFDVSRKDAEALMLADARESAAKYGVFVERLELKIVPETPRSLQVSLYVATTVAFIPAGMLFRAHVTVNDAMTAQISGLTCDGDEALGPLIVGLLRPALAKYNGNTRPLVIFPAGKMKLHDVAVHVDDGLHLRAAFGT
jgi:hypothetical protein